MYQLTTEDLARLSHNPSPEVRASIGKKIARDHEDRRYSEYERVLAEKIMSVLSEDAEVLVRSRLAWELRSSSTIPKDIALKLAQDVEEVSLPLLKFSPLLEPEDLIEIIQQGSTDKNMVIASRETIPEPVSDALAETRDKLVVRVLLENDTAEIGGETLDALEEYFGGDTRLRTLLTDRRAVQKSISRLIIRKIANEVKSRVLKNRKDELADYEEMFWNSEPELASILLEDNIDKLDYEAIVETLLLRGELDGAFVHMTLDFERRDLFELSASKLLNIDIAKLKDILENGGTYGRIRLFERLNIDEASRNSFMEGLDRLYGVVKDDI